MTNEQKTEINLLIATMRCFNEQLYNIKGAHKNRTKQFFNRLVKVSAQYEKAVLEMTNNDPHLENMYDTLMDVLVTIKTEIAKNDNQK